MVEYKFKYKKYNEVFGLISEYVIKNTKDVDKESVVRYLDNIKDVFLQYDDWLNLTFHNIISYSDKIEISIIFTGCRLCDFILNKNDLGKSYNLKYKIAKPDKITERYLKRLKLYKVNLENYKTVYMFENYEDVISFVRIIT